MKNENDPTAVPTVDDFRMKVAFFFREKIAQLKKIARLLLVLLVIGSAVGIFFWQRNRNSAQNKPQPDVATQIPADAGNTFANDVSGVSPAIDSSTAEGDLAAKAFLKSEQYQISEISFGGSSELLLSETASLPLQVNSVRSEMLSSKDGSQSNLLIRWKTNKMASSDVSYDSGGAPKKLSEGGFGYSHALVLADLEQSQRYTFVISAVDRWGNESHSENFSVYTGKKQASVIDLITAQFKDIFSWAVKK
jgi:hypothetical protein